MKTDNTQRESFVFHREWFEVISKRDEKTRLEIYDAIMRKVFNGEDSALSMLASVVMDFVTPQIERDTHKWADIRAKRSNAGSKHKGNQYITNVEQNGTNESNGTSVPTLEQNGTNGSVYVSKDTNVSMLDNILDIKDKEKEDKSSKKKQENDFVERIYSMYPTKCPVRGVSLGKCSKDKERIRKLLKTYSQEDVERVVRKEVDEKYGKHYMANFSTFLNNFPDPNSLFEDQSVLNNEQELYPQGYWQ